jgi:hypothetical protein
MIEILIGVLIVFGIIFIIPFILYGIFSAFKIIETPKQDNAKNFMYNIIVTKIGTSLLFVLLFYYINLYLPDFWLIYGMIWVISAAIGELGDTFKPNYTFKEAIIGIMSELIYFPLSAVILDFIL